MAFIKKNLVYIKICIALVCLCAFFMIFANQVSYDAGRYGGAYSFSFMAYYISDNSNYFVWSIVGYIFIFIAVGVLVIGIYQNANGKSSKALDIISLVLIGLGGILIGFVGLFFRESYIAYNCGSSYSCASSSRSSAYRPASGALSAIILAALAFIGIIICMCTAKKEKEDSKETSEQLVKEDTNHHLLIVFIKGVIALFCLVSFFMLFTHQVTYTDSYRSAINDFHFVQVFFLYGFNALGSLFGYLFLFSAATILCISAIRTYQDKKTKWLDISSIILMVVGLLLIAFVAIMFRESEVELACGLNKECAYDERNYYTFYPAVGPIIAIVFTGLAIILQVTLMVIGYRQNKNPELDSQKENDANLS